MGDIFFTCKSGSQNISGVPRVVDICASIRNQKQPSDEGGDHEEENRELKYHVDDGHATKTSLKK